MSALESLYKAMYREIFGYLCSMLGGDTQSAEDLAQDTFVRVWKYAPRFSSLGRGRSWVYRIASRLALDHLGKNAYRADELKEDLPDRKRAGRARAAAGDVPASGGRTENCVHARGFGAHAAGDCRGAADASRHSQVEARRSDQEAAFRA